MATLAELLGQVSNRMAQAEAATRARKRTFMAEHGTAPWAPAVVQGAYRPAIQGMKAAGPAIEALAQRAAANQAAYPQGAARMNDYYTRALAPQGMAPDNAVARPWDPANPFPGVPTPAVPTLGATPPVVPPVVPPPPPLGETGPQLAVPPQPNPSDLYGTGPGPGGGNWINPYGTGIAAPQPVYGSQYGANGYLDLSDLGMAGLTATDQQYLAGQGLYYNPQSQAAYNNASAWGVSGLGPSWEQWQAQYGGAPAYGAPGPAAAGGATAAGGPDAPWGATAAGGATAPGAAGFGSW